MKKLIIVLLVSVFATMSIACDNTVSRESKSELDSSAPLFESYISEISSSDYVNITSGELYDSVIAICENAELAEIDSDSILINMNIPTNTDDVAKVSCEYISLAEKLIIETELLDSGYRSVTLSMLKGIIENITIIDKGNGEYFQTLISTSTIFSETVTEAYENNEFFSNNDSFNKQMSEFKNKLESMFN